MRSRLPDGATAHAIRPLRMSKTAKRANIARPPFKSLSRLNPPSRAPRRVGSAGLLVGRPAPAKHCRHTEEETKVRAQPWIALAQDVHLASSMQRKIDALLVEVAESRAKLRASEDALQRTEKLRALGQMAAGITHDLGNVLNPIALYLQAAKRALDRGDTKCAGETIDSVRATLQHATEMLVRFRDFSRQSPEAMLENVDLNQLVREAAELAMPHMAARGRRLSAIKVVAGAPPHVLARPSEVLSAIVNLVVNAIDAMPDGGTITLRTGESESAAWVDVSDDGPGMTAEVRQHVFDAFFTTKGAHGTGLGLAMVLSCMQRHGGSVSLDTTPGKGSTFKLSIPRAA